MNIAPDEKIQIARFLNFLLSGEKTAHRCAKKQARLCADTQLQHFLKNQARQERFHALTFQSAVLWLAPKGVSCPASGHMLQYESLLSDAIENHDLPASIFGLQVILEGMGDIILERLNHGINQRGIGYQKIRKAIIAQEDTHHKTGLSYLENNFEDTTMSLQYRHLINDYLFLIDEIFFSLRGLLDYFESDISEYINSFNQNIPYWVHLDALDHHTHA